MSLTTRLVIVIAGPVAIAAVVVGLVSDGILRTNTVRVTTDRAESVVRLLRAETEAAIDGVAARPDLERRLEAVPGVVGVVRVGGGIVATVPAGVEPPERLRQPALNRSVGRTTRTTLLGVPVLASWVATDRSTPDQGFWVAFDRRPVDRRIASARLVTGCVVVLAVAGAVLVAIVTAGSIVPPLNAAVEVLEGIASGGDVRRRDPSGPPEIRRLGRSVNRLVQTLAWARRDRHRHAEEEGGRTRYLQQSNRALLDLANRDPLTGLANRRRLEIELERSLEMARSARQGVSVVMMDLDRFKQYNDAAGHLAGDALLRSVAKALRGRTRVTDLVVRWGGDEFCVLLPFTASERALMAARSLIEAVGECVGSLDVDNGVQRVGASAGVACFPEDAATGEDLVARADEALFEAKRRGGGIALRIEADVRRSG